MTLAGLFYLAPAVVSFAISVAIGAYAYRRRAVAGASSFSLVAIAEALWTLGFMLEVMSSDMRQKIIWDNSQFIPMLILGPAFLAFAFEFGRRKLERHTFWPALLIIPVIGTLLVLTDPLHHWVRPNAWIIPGTPFSALHYDFTPFDFIMFLYSFGLITIAAGILIVEWVRQHWIYRAQLTVILLGFAIIYAGEALVVSGLLETPQRDVSPLVFALSNLMIAWGLFRLWLFDIVPVARDAVIEAMSGEVVVLDMQDRIVDINPAALRALGQKGSEVIGQPVDVVYSRWPALIERLKEGSEAEAELELQTPEGPRYYEFSAAPVGAQRGRQIGRLFILRDVTERYLSEQTVRYSEARLQGLVQAMQDISFILDRSGCFLEVLSARDEMIYVPLDQVMGRCVSDIFSPASAEKYLGTIQRTLDTWEPQTLEYSLDIDGQQLWFEGHTTPLQATLDQPPRVLWVARDITQRKQAEDALRASEEQATATLNALSAHITILDETGRLLATNRAWRSFAQANGADLGAVGEGANYLEVCERATGLGYEEGRSMAAGIRAVLHGELPFFEMEYPCHAPHQDRWFIGRVTPFTGTGAPRVVVSHEEITTRKKVEQAEHEQRQLAEALREIAAALNSTLDLDELLDRILDSAQTVVGHDAANIALIGEGGVVRVVRQRGYEKWGLAETLLKIERHVESSAELMWMIAERKPLIIPNIGDRTAHEAFRAALRSYAGVPIVVDGAVIGFLQLNSETEGFFDDEYAETLSVFAHQIGTAFRNAQLFSRARYHNVQLQRLNEMIRASSEAPDLDALLSQLVHSAGEIVGADECLITVWDGQQQRITHAQTNVCDPRAFTQMIQSIPPGEQTFTRMLLDTKYPVLFEDPSILSVRSFPDTAHSTMQAGAGLHLWTGEQDVGALVFGFDEPHRFTMDEIGWASQTADLITLAIARAQAYAELQKERDFAQQVMNTMGQGLMIVDFGDRYRYVNPAFGAMFGYQPGELIGKTVRETIAPSEDVGLFRQLSASLQAGRSEHFEFTARHRDGHEMYLLISASPRVESGVITGSISVTTDLSERIQIERAEREQRMLSEALRDAAAALNSTLDLESVLDLLFDQLARVVSFDAASLMLSPEERVKVMRHRGYPASVRDVLDTPPFPIEQAPYMLQMQRTGEPVVLEDIRDDPAFVRPPDVTLRSYCGVPIKRGEEVLGFLNLEGKLPGMFTHEHVERLVTFADIAAIAIENARAYEQAQRAAVLEERQRLARELHDAVSQTLFSASMIAEMLPRLWLKTPDRIPDYAVQLHRLIRGAMAEMRALLFELRPAALIQADLRTLVGHLLDAVGGRSTLKTSLDASGDCTLPPAVKIALYRVVQEALNNVLKHAHANEVFISLHCSKSGVEITIADDGRGFERERVPSGHFGLEIMHERAAEIGAIIEVSSQRGQGTKVRVRWHDPEGVKSNA